MSRSCQIRHGFDHHFIENQWDLPKPAPPSLPGRSILDPVSGFTYEVDLEYLEHARREAIGEHAQPELPWDD